MDKKITKTVKEFKAALGKMNIRVNKMILFGSYAAESPRLHSDIDIAVISNDFKDMSLIQRLETIGIALANARIFEPIEPLAYTEEEFNSKGKGSFVFDEIKKQGIEII